MNAAPLKSVIESAFADVTLSGGVSLRQAEVMDNYGEGCSEEKFAALPLEEVTTDWRHIPRDELDRNPYLSYMDPPGFRYYIPAFMHSMIDAPTQYVDRWSATLHSLCPKSGDLWDHSMMHYSALDLKQRSAIAAFLEWVSEDTRFRESNRKDAKEALATYWRLREGRGLES